MKVAIPALVVLLTLIAGCTPAQTLTALELARKLGSAVCSLCPDETP